MEFTWKFLFDNEENKYKCSFEQIQDNVVYTCEAMCLLHQMDQMLEDQKLNLLHDV
jgi:hypothetical protein